MTGKDGTVTVENLPLGLYLVTQQGVVNGYYAIAPFLVTLPMTGADGKPTYEVIASPKSNPTPPTTPPGPTPSYTSRAVRKLWKDDGADRPTFITVVLMRNGVPYQTVILSDENNWQYIWEGLDVYSYWSVAEGDVPDGYQVSIDVSGNLTTLTNTRREYPENPEQLTVVKVWEDTGREDSRPECITVELLRGEEVYDAAVLNEENGWTYTWTDLPAYGNWSVREASVPDGYESQITVDGEVVVITNTRVEDIPKTTQITAKKIWSGGTPADSVTVELLRDGQPEDSVKLGEWNGWEYSWRALSPEYEWTVREVDVPKGYAVSYTVNGEVVTVTNTAKLIQTGQLNWPIPALAASGAALLLLGLILLADKRKTQ